VTGSSASGVIPSTLTPLQASCLRNSAFKRATSSAAVFMRFDIREDSQRRALGLKAFSIPGARPDAIRDSPSTLLAFGVPSTGQGPSTLYASVRASGGIQQAKLSAQTPAAALKRNRAGLKASATEAVPRDSTRFGSSASSKRPHDPASWGRSFQRPARHRRASC
jgi:hypothetical protein